MSNLESARARIREAIINTMDPRETRELVAKIENVIEARGESIDEDLFEEYVGEVISAREDFDESEMSA